MKKIKFFLPVYFYTVFQLYRVLFVMPWNFYGRSTIRAIASLLGWKNPCDKINNNAPTLTLNDVIPTQSVRILHPTAYLGDVSTYELYVLNSLVKAFGPKSVFEIGTLHGRTTVNLLENAERLETLYTLDILEQLPANKFSDHLRAARVKRIVTDSRKLNVEPFSGQIDFIFIDADHTYDAVINDSDKALQMLSPKGILAWHDYSMVSDTKLACHDFMRRNPNRRYVHILDTTLLLMLAD